jgi:hypothetical protein
MVSFKKGYGRVSPVVVLPDSILVDGPQSILHRLPDSIGVKVNAVELSSNYKAEVEIEMNGQEFISLSPGTAKVIFEVGRVEEVRKKIGLKRKGKPSGDSVLVRFQIPLDKVLDFNSAAKEIVATEKRSSVSLSHLPRYAFLIRIDSVAYTK